MGRRTHRPSVSRVAPLGIVGTLTLVLFATLLPGLLLSHAVEVASPEALTSPIARAPTGIPSIAVHATPGAAPSMMPVGPSFVKINNFFVNRSAGIAPLHVQFTALATGNKSLALNFTFNWTFGNGLANSSTFVNVSAGKTASASVIFVYNSVGFFNATLTVSDNDKLDGSVHSLPIAIRTGNPFTVALQSTLPNSTSGTLVRIVPMVAGGVPYNSPPVYVIRWTVVPVNCPINTTLEWMNCTESTPGNYTVHITVQDNASDSLGASLTFHVAPKIGLTLGSSSSFTCLGTFGVLIGNFTATSTGGTGPISVDWSFGDGTVGSGSRVSHTFALGQNYTVSADANDSGGGSANGSTQLVGIYPACGTTGSPTFSAPVAVLEVTAIALGLLILVLGVLLLRSRPPAPVRPHPITPADVPRAVSDPSSTSGAHGDGSEGPSDG